MQKNRNGSRVEGGTLLLKDVFQQPVRLEPGEMAAHSLYPS